MAKPISLTADDLRVKTPLNAGATPQRGEAPKPKEKPAPVEKTPLHFLMPAEFVDEFKAEAVRRRMKLNQLLKYSFDEMRKNTKNS